MNVSLKWHYFITFFTNSYRVKDKQKKCTTKIYKSSASNILVLGDIFFFSSSLLLLQSSSVSGLKKGKKYLCMILIFKQQKTTNTLRHNEIYSLFIAKNVC